MIPGNGLDMEFSFDPLVPVVPNGFGDPDCIVNPAIGKEATSFTYLPVGCTFDTDCTSVDVVILSIGNTDPIPDGSKLFDCTVVADAAASPGDYELVCLEARYSTPPPAQGFDATCENGFVSVP